MAAVARRDTNASSSRGEGHGPTIMRKKTGSSGGRDEKAMIGQWRIGRTIGKGSSGRVKIAKHSITGKYAAIKIVPKGMIIESRMSMAEAGARQDKVLLGIEREIVIMKLIDHPNVLNLYDVWETSSELYLIMEYVPGGELFDYLVKRGRLPVSEALHYFQQIIFAVDYCHRFNICHRDLKPENLLLDKDKNIKVADFGMAAWEAGERMLETSCGSPHYASPEIVAGKAYHGSSSDIWSCGIILFALLTGRLPFDDDNIRSLLQKVKIGVFEMPDEIKDPARDLLKRMLEKDPERRIQMPDILRHPFFVSRPPRPIPGRALVSPPSLTEVERPVNSPEEIDADIMGNLKTLWSGATDDEIVAALMSKEKTWEKAIYHLLIKYRSKHLENYNMDDDEEEDRAKRQARKQAGAPSPAKRKGGAPTAARQPRLEPLGENETIQERTTSPTPVTRPQAPTPKKASGGAVVVEDSPAAKKIQAQAQAPRSPAPAGPRPPSSRGNSYTPTTEPSTPAIFLHEATPTKESMPPPAVIPSPRPRSALSSPTSETPQLPPLNVPQVQDERLQHFFNEVANQLNTMNIRSSVASGSSTGSNILGSDYHAYMAYAAGLPSPATSPVEEENDQFADADDDHSEVASIVSSVAHVQGQHSPLVGLGLGGPPSAQRPGLYPMPTQNPHRWSYASSSAGTTSSQRRASSGSYTLESPQVQVQAQVQHGWQPQESIMQQMQMAPPAGVLQAARAAPAPPPRGASRLAPTRPAPARPSPAPLSSMSRDESFVMIDSIDTPTDPSVKSWSSRHGSLSRGQDAFGMLKKRKKNLTVEPVPYTPGSSGPSSAGSSISPNSILSPKRSWFNNLFSFKPATCTLLSPDNIANTRDKARKALMGMNVRVEVVEIDGLRGLKCRFDEVKDINREAVVKGVRFRVEFSRSTPLSHGGYNTLVCLTQEKGAQSTFGTLFLQLKSALEEPAAPAVGRPSFHQTHSQSYNSRPAPQPLLAAPPVRYTASAPTTPVVASTPRFTASPTPGSAASAGFPSPMRF